MVCTRHGRDLSVQPCDRYTAGSAAHDLTTVPGLIAAVIAVLAISAGGLCHLATVCMSFVFINAATHGRCMAIPEGWREVSPEYMQIGTCLAARSAILAMLTWSMGAMWVLEQLLLLA